MALGQLIGIIPITVAAGVAMKVSERMLGPTGPQTRRPRSTRRKAQRYQSRPRINHPGNFSNVGL